MVVRLHSEIRARTFIDWAAVVPARLEPVAPMGHSDLPARTVPTPLACKAKSFGDGSGLDPVGPAMRGAAVCCSPCAPRMRNLDTHGPVRPSYDRALPSRERWPRRSSSSDNLLS